LLDRLGNEVDFTELFMEETLSSKDKKELPDSMYGLVYTDEKGNKVRKFPLNDESHVRQAAIFFDRAKGLSDDQKRELARNIVRRAKELDMDYSGWESLKPYLDKSVKESFMTYEWLMKQNYPDPDSTSGTSDFDDSDKEPDDCYTESFEEMFGPVIQEAFDAITGEEIPIDKAYSLEEMKERTYTEEELKKSKREIKDYLKFANDIVKRISNQVEKDAKPPTGNQNCLLCTWCAEIGFRGVNKNPRPVYSPCDPIFKVHGENIVRDPMKIIPRGYDNLLEHLADVSQPFARFYVHVNWKGSRGGHEFLLLKVIDDECYIVDAQAGKVDKLSDTHKYFTDINWENSYLCRLDNKNFNRKLFDTMNDPKMTLPWDPKRDIPYMLREGLITKDEAETELKRAETNEFYKELKKALGQTPIQESVTEDLMSLLPKDLQEWLKKGDFSKLEKDESYYYVEGHPVEEFFKEPEFCKGYYYPDEENDPILHCIVFSNDNGNGLVYDWIDECYYYAYHDWIDDDTGFLHRERLSSKSWSIIVNPTHIKKFKDQQEKSRIASEELKNLKSSQIYGDISHASNKYFGKGIFKSDLKDILSRWYKMGLDWCNDVIDFAEKYDFPKLKEAIEYFENHSIPEFSPSITDAHGWNVEAYKEGAAKVVAAFNDVEDKLSFTHIQEGAWGDIRNGVNPWSMKRVFHISPEGHLDGQVFKPRVPEYLDKYDPSKTEFEDVETPRVCFSPSIECCLNAIIVNIGRWKTANKLRDWYVYIPEKPLKEYKYRTNKQLIDEKKVYDANLTKEIWIEEPVRLKQYGIIRIDSVTDANRKKAVPTTLGESKKRNVYDFKWHWLVKPNVIKDVPYDYSPNSVCEDMISDLSRFKYGLGYDGSIHKGSSKDYDEKYRLESPEEFEKNGGGICYDFVEWEVGYLEAYGYTCRKFFISTDTEDMDTHTFILVDDGNGKFIYPEAAFKLLEGVHKVGHADEAIRMIVEKIWDINNNAKKYDKINYYVWEYSGHPPYGSDMKTCHKYFSKGEPFHEGSLNKPEKIK